MGLDVDLVVPLPPKTRRRRWVRLLRNGAVALVLLWLLAFVFATWDRHRATEALRKRGMPASYDEAVAAMHAKVGSETGADLLRRAIKENEKLGRPGDFYVPAKHDFVADDADRARLDALARQCDPVMVLLNEALKHPPAPFTRSGEIGADPALRSEEAQNLRSFARLMWPLIKRAVLRGDHDEAVRLLKVSFQIGERLSTDELIIPQLIHVAILGVANAYAHAVLPAIKLNEKQFRELDELLAGIERGLTFERALINERGAMATLFEDPEALKSEMYSAVVGQVPEWMRGAGILAERGWVELVRSPIGLPVRRRAAAYCLSVPDEVLALVDHPPPWPDELQKKYEPWQSTFNSDRLMLTARSSSAFGNVYWAGLRARRRLVLTRLALRLKWHFQVHGRLPERLEEVCDATMTEIPLKWFEGRPLAYTKTDRSFRIDAEPSPADQVYGSALAREDVRVGSGLLAKMEFAAPAPVKKGP